MTTIIEEYVDNDDDSVNSNDTDPIIGQTFTIGNTGDNLTIELSEVSIKVSRTNTPGITAVEIFEVNPGGYPIGTALSTGSFDGDALGTTNSTATPWTNITMTGATLKASTTYALVLTPADTDATDFVNWRSDESSPAYTGGNYIAFEGGAWIKNTGWDVMFQIRGGTYEGTLCTLANAVNKAGANASSSGTNEVLVSDYVRQAEGTINWVTRFNWVKAYPALSDDVKFGLNQVASDLAAIYIITYDMSAYTADTVEAETMLNIYREAVARGLSLLRNQEVARFIQNDT